MPCLVRTLAAIAASLYLGAIVVPCQPGNVLSQADTESTTVSVLCPCHTGHATPGSGVGADWQGPPVVLAATRARDKAPGIPALPVRPKAWVPEPASPVPIV